MTKTPAQLDAHLKTMKGKHNYWPNIPGHQCMVIFASVNKFLGGPGYAAAGAKDLWNNPSLASAYTQLGPGTTPQFGDIGIYNETWGGGWGHIVVAVSNINASSYRGFGQNPGIADTTVLSKAGLSGWLRPKALTTMSLAKPTPPTTALVNRTVTQATAWVRTRPDHRAPLAPGLGAGVARGVNLSIKGWTVGTDPFGTNDNAWYVTRSGYYVWANAAQNTLAGLRRL